MKSLTTNLMLAAAALIVVAGSASAQVMTAEIPFAFNANGAHLAPGTYRLTVRTLSSSTPVVQLYSADSKAGAMTVVSPGTDAPKSWFGRKSAMLSFACADGRCDLRRIWTGDAVRTFEVPTPKNARSSLAGVEIVNISASKAD